QYQRTIAACTEVIEHGNQLTERERAAAFRIRGYSRYQAKDDQGAINDLTQAITLDPSDPIAYLFRAYARERAEDLSGAAEDATQALRFRPDDADTLLARAEIFRRERLFDRAYEDINRVVELKPEGQNYLERAEICFDSATGKGQSRAPCDIKSALADIERAKQSSEDPYTESDAFALEGRIYESQDQYRRAYEAYEKGLDADIDCDECDAGEKRIKAREASGGQGDQAGLLARINAEIGRAVYYSGRYLVVTTQLRSAGNGLIEIDGHLCTG